MFKNDCYLTSGVIDELELEIQIMLWELIEALDEPKDYLQVFEITKLADGKTKIEHRQEEPEYCSEIIIDFLPEKDYLKIFVIDSGDYTMMLLADDY